MNAIRKGHAIAAFAALAGVLAATSASATPLITSRPVDLHLGRLVIVLILCIGLAVAAAFLLKRIAKTGGRAKVFAAPFLRGLGGASVTVLESRRISVHADVCRFACDGREYLVVVSPGGATVLKEDASQAEAPP